MFGAIIGDTVGSLYEFLGSIDFDYSELEDISWFIICQYTVPVALYCFLISNSFEDCLRKTIALGGDTDTAAAISCSVAEAYYKELPRDLLSHCLMKLQVKNSCDIIKLINAHTNQLIEYNVSLK